MFLQLLVLCYQEIDTHTQTHTHTHIYMYANPENIQDSRTIALLMKIANLFIFFIYYLLSWSQMAF